MLEYSAMARKRLFKKNFIMKKKYVSPVCRAYNLEIESAILSNSYDMKEDEIDDDKYDTNKKANSIWQDMDTESNCGTAMGW